MNHSSTNTINTKMMRRLTLFLILSFSLAAQKTLGQKPDIEYINRHRGPMGMKVTVVGSGFAPEASRNRVFFGSVPARVISASETLLTVRVPAGATYAPLSVTNLQSNLTAHSRLPFLLSFHGGQQPNLDFHAPVSFDSEIGINDLVTCDLDLDGRADIASAHINSTRIAILANQSDVSSILLEDVFPSGYPLNSQSIYINAGDINGDGKPELVVSRYGVPAKRIFILLNTSTPGNISFAQPVHVLVDGDKVRQVAIADLDLDGKNDIVVTNTDNKKITLLRNKGSIDEILMERMPSYEITDPNLGSDRNTFGLAVADLNGDKFPDMVINGFTQKNVFVVPNTSTPGSIRFGAIKEIESVGNLVNVAVADVNHDLRPDIIATKLLQNKVAVFLNRTALGTGSSTSVDFAPEVEFDVSAEPYGLDMGDMNGDGKVDIVVSSQSDEQDRLVDVMLNQSSSTGIGFETVSFAVPSASKFLSVGDINGDAKPDVTLAGFETNQISILLNNTCLTPVIYSRSPINACVGDELVLRATPSPALQYTWIQTTNGISTELNNETPVLTLSPSEGVHNIVVRVMEPTGNCAIESDPITLDVQMGDNIDMKPAIIQPGRICTDASAELTLETTSLTAGAQYRWIAPDHTETVADTIEINSASLADAGEYVVIAEKGHCRSVPDTLLLEVVKAPKLYVQSEMPSSICEGYSALLQTVEDSRMTYQWTRDGSDIPDANGASFEATAAGSYAVKGLYFQTCPVESPSYSLATLAPPVAAFNLPEKGCVESVIHFENTSTFDPNAQVYYHWTNDDIGVTNIENPSHAYDLPGQYQVSLRVYYSDERCAANISKTIDIGDIPVVQIGHDGQPEICEGEELILTADGTFESYAWNNGATGSSIAVTESGTYEVTVRNAHGCEGKSSLDVIVHPAPDIAITPANPSITPGESLQLTASGAATYAWDDVEGIEDLYIANPFVSPLNTTIYSVQGVDANNCTGSAEITVIVSDALITVDEQALLTPNGDSKNEHFVVEGIEYHPEYQVSIFNRNGVKIYERSNYHGNEWDGTYNGKSLTNGVYYYVISDSGKKIKSGSITMLK